MHFNIPVLSSGVCLEWKRGSAKSHAGAGWVPVKAADFDGMFKRAGFKGYVRRRGLTLMKRIDWHHGEHR